MDLGRARPILVTDKGLFDKYLSQFPPEISEFTFTNLFMWRKYYNWEFLEHDAHLLVFTRDYFREHHAPIKGDLSAWMFLPPIGPDPAHQILRICQSFPAVEFHRVPPTLGDEVQALFHAHDLGIGWQDDRDCWDYVYARDALATLSGGALKPKRKWLNRFQANYKYEFQMLSPDKPELLDCVRKAQETWCRQNACEDTPDLVNEDEAIDEALKNAQALKFQGALIQVNGQCIAYTLGELLRPGTMVTHIEKAHAEYEGAYQAIMSEFVQAPCWEGVQYVNREQDLGISGLRRAKESYDPHHMVKKGILFH